MKLIECVPNVSEGRDENILSELREAVSSVPGVTLMNFSSDVSHNRSVVSFLGPPDGVLEAAFRLSKCAVERIDLNIQRGEHPRMGAIDVIPLIPIQEATMDECVCLSKKLGERLWRELGLPVFLYEKSATSGRRENLAEIRRGQFEGMGEKMRKLEWAPDYGESTPHKTAGVVAVGARMPLIAFNMNLNTDRLDIAKAIAKTIRQSSGGLPYVKAIGIMLKEKNMAQVSVNMIDYQKTPLHKVVELVKAEAHRYDVQVAECEIVGLTPAQALIDSAVYYMQLCDFDPEVQVLDNFFVSPATF